MQKFMLTTIIIVVCVISGFAQTTGNVDEAIRYRVNTSVTALEQTNSQISSMTVENSIVVDNRSNSQLEEMGSRLGFTRSNSQLEEMGSRLGFTRSNSQLEEMGSRLGFTR
jgi:hypothetical protein